MRKNKRKVPKIDKFCLDGNVEGSERQEKCDDERGSESSGPWPTQLDDYNYRLLDAAMQTASPPASPASPSPPPPFDSLPRKKKNAAQSDVSLVQWESFQTKEEKLQNSEAKYEKPLGRSIDRRRQLERSRKGPSRGASAQWHSGSPSFLLLSLLHLLLLWQWSTVAYGKSTC